MKIRIYYEDTDAGGIVYHTNYIKFCERARSEAFFQAGLNFTKEGGYFVVSSLEAKFIASAVLGDEIFVRSKVLEIKKASIVLEQEIYKFDDKNAEKLLFRATITLAFMKEEKLAKINDEIKKFLENSKF
ncbi:YbgC/FadM family acyl-CoA thioesterase [Campylobacter concisus]|uniref:YbgC/FadM family acyl-CoA thioesterase n=1 Tax=Campylobacter concisus TaxID=199 RepID=A0AAE7P356_9BACT|nr:YbgC/FadM family acyl-CoA thioesterase [Campylobacter concisus]OJJ28443.1 acyl-CoA thioester hydrolase [Campylobacter concisus]ORI04256.1 acyl-CoA thioester hydrolase [Campylobacter concisus]QPH86148.1 YbgC/FadM family acyl-CoA thioesterase [Campylobacter concisus]QPH99256.1 YbgC/FadM family acyl-CoA thioesterase [Campylobacter concisus]QPI01052.1 YbgC/FadM family acyl-CoA thioesterase [Campylobacter concisus]